MYGEPPTNRPTRGSVGDRPLCPNGLGGDRPLCPAGLGGDRPLSSRARRFCQGHAHVLPRLPRLPGPCACPPAPAGSAWDARISTWAMRMSACTRLACPGRAHVYLGHVHVRPDQPPRAHGRSCRLRPATWRTTSASAGSRKPTAFVTALSLPVPPALLGRGTLLRPCDRGICTPPSSLYLPNSSMHTCIFPSRARSPGTFVAPPRVRGLAGSRTRSAMPNPCHP